MARIAQEESQDFSWVAKGWEEMSFFVCFLYVFKAAENIVSKFVEDVEVEGIWDIVWLTELVGCLRQNKRVAGADSGSLPSSELRLAQVAATCNTIDNSQS